MIRSKAQQGVVLFIALIILVAMSLAGIALMRSVDTGTIIAGNLAFRQNATFVADLGVEAARDWLRAQSAANLFTDQLSGTSAYYATWRDDIDLLNSPYDARTDFDWTAAGPSINVTAAPYTPPTGYAVRYVIHRLCWEAGDPAQPTTTANPPSNFRCLRSASAGTGTSGTGKGVATYGSYALASPVSAVYRVTVMVSGPRNARSYVQTIVF